MALKSKDLLQHVKVALSDLGLEQTNNNLDEREGMEFSCLLGELDWSPFLKNKLKIPIKGQSNLNIPMYAKYSKGNKSSKREINICFYIGQSPT